MNLRLKSGKILRNKSSSSCIVVNKMNNQNPSDKKMYLVLDLDHTLVNSTPLVDLSLEEQFLKGKIMHGDPSKRSLFLLHGISVMTKLRPFVRTFLYELSKMFEMYIYTMGDCKYALEVAKLLDPEGKYFGSRIISRNDSLGKSSKGLDITGKPENSVLILDDSEKFWPNHKDNLIVMDKYIYFSSSCRHFGYEGKSLAELNRDEDETDGALFTVLRVLKRIHRDCLDSNLKLDVREVLKDVRKTVLKGCKIVFSGIVPTNYQANEHKLWKMAEELGATCCVDVETDITHVVSADDRTTKSRWAIEKGKFLVQQRWVEAAYILWRRQLENMFMIINKSNNNSPRVNNSPINNNRVNATTTTTINNKNNIVNTNDCLLSMLEKDKLNETNFLDWYQNLRTALKTENKEYVLEKPLPEEPKDNAPQEIRNAFKIHSDNSLEVTCVMLLTMNSELQKRFENMDAYEIIVQLECMFQKETGMELQEASLPLLEPKLEKAKLQSNDVMNNIRSSKNMDISHTSHDAQSDEFWMQLDINEMEKLKKCQDMHMIEEKNINLNKPNEVLMVSKGNMFKKISKGKKPRKGKNVMCAKGINNPVVALKTSPNKAKSDQKCFYCNKLAHWKRNCPKYLNDIKNNIGILGPAPGAKRELESHECKENLC